MRQNVIRTSDSFQWRLRLALALSIVWIFYQQIGFIIWPNDNNDNDDPRDDHSNKLLLRSSSEQLPPPSPQGSSSSSAKFAYASLIGGVDPSNPSYRGFFYHVLVAAKLLRMFGSKADFILMIQLSSQTPLQELPSKDKIILDKMNILIEYIPKSEHQNFYEINLQKFYILSFTRYERILYMDADVMPLTNLDYLFEHSMGLLQPTLQENIVLAGRQEPSTGSFFLLSPQLGTRKIIHDIISKREYNAKNLPFPKFDPIHGWGHVFLHDKWETIIPTKHGNKWSFYGADADQGLLYEYTKYVRQNVSIIIGKKVQNWVPGTAATATTIVSSSSSLPQKQQPQLDSVLVNPFQNKTSSSSTTHVLLQKKWRAIKGLPKPYCDYYHFAGRSKPWESDIPKNLTMENHLNGPKRYWFFHLLQIDQEMNLFDIHNTASAQSAAEEDDVLNNNEWWETIRSTIETPPLGRFNVKQDMANRVDRTNNMK